jgi:hypothetical protein
VIPEYKLYHGAFLAELIQRLERPVLIDEHAEPGRLSSYVIDDRVGVQIKHSAQRMHPWPFTFTRQNLSEHDLLRAKCETNFVVFVCHTDGMVCVPLEDVQDLLEIGESDQAWIRIDRKKRQWYSVSGGRGEAPNKRPRGLDVLIDRLNQNHPQALTAATSDPMPQTKERSRFSFFSRGPFR